MKAQITKIFRGKSRAAFEKSVIVLRFDRKFVSRYYFYKYIKKHVCLLLKLITRQTTSFFDRIKYQSFFKRRIGMEKNFVPGFITLPTLANVWVVGVIFPHSHCFKLCLKYTFSHSHCRWDMKFWNYRFFVSWRSIFLWLVSCCCLKFFLNKCSASTTESTIPFAKKFSWYKKKNMADRISQYKAKKNSFFEDN